MTCPRCGSPVPDNQLACACFMERARIEAQQLAAHRFLAREQSLSQSKEGHAIDRISRQGFCVAAVNMQFSTTVYTLDKIKCNQCRAAIEFHAEKYRERMGL